MGHCIHQESDPIARVPVRIAVIGAGMAGTSCSNNLVACGYDVLLFDKGRGAGGRMATRRYENASFDHGAQYFTARSAMFRMHVRQWRLDGIVAPWRPRIWRFGPTLSPHVTRDPTWYVGVPSMSAILRHDQRGLNIKFETKIEHLQRVDGQWRLTDRDGHVYDGFTHIVLAIPAPQARRLLDGEHSEICALLSGVTFDPCWAGLLTFADPIEAPFEAATIDHGIIAWMARNTSKPNREGVESWVVHACTEWSVDHLEEDPTQVAGEIAEAFANMVDVRHQPINCTAHRWRYARANRPLGQPYLFDSALGVGACGDWCIAGRLEAAYLSGIALAEGIITASPVNDSQTDRCSRL